MRDERLEMRDRGEKPGSLVSDPSSLILHPSSLILHRSLLGALLMAGMFFPFGLVARGQDDWDAGKKDADRPNRQFAMALPNFEQWVLGGKTRDQFEGVLKSQLAVQVESVTRACELSAAQREKVQLAGEGDLKRLLRMIEQFRAKFLEAGQDPQKINAIYREASVLQMKMQTGIYGDSSLFQKVLRRTLDHKQSARYEQQERERRKFRYEAKIELVLSNLENGLALRAEQRQRLVKLLLDETEPPKKFGPYDFYFVIFQAGKVGEEKFKPILDDAQWKSLKKVLDQYGRLEPFLKSQGYLP
jgi:hypothetical protein